MDMPNILKDKGSIKILIIDDDIIRDLLGAILSLSGFENLTFSKDGIEGLRLVNKTIEEDKPF